MWEQNLNRKDTGKRFFTIKSPLLEVVKARGLVIEGDTLIISHKELKETKELLQQLTINILKDETLEILQTIETVEDFSIQGEDEWKYVRLRGIVTGSNTPFTSKGTPIPTFESYCNQKAMEMYYHSVATEDEQVNIDWSDDPMGYRSYKSTEMKRGNELESHGVEKWLKRNPSWISETKGLIYSDALGAGVSLDLLVTDLVTMNQKILEFKSPTLKTFIGYLVNPYRAKNKYQIQVNLQMMLTGIHQAELVIYYPNQALIRINYEFDIEFAINALQTLKEFRNRVQEGISSLVMNIEKD